MTQQQEAKEQRRLYTGLAIWLLINLVQAIFTEIHPDEAYYAMWAKHPDLGYFDHPPMVAYLIKLSSYFFSGNLGVRFITILLQPLTLWITWLLCHVPGQPREKRMLIFFISAAAMTMLSAYGFITTPDVPLLFFTALVLFAYKRFLTEQSSTNILLLSIAMAGLIYSKYQGGVVILLLIISNMRLLRSRGFWMAGILALTVCIPHFLWQFTHQFPSFRYQLMGRSAGFQWSYVFEYLPNQLATFNPFVLAAMVWLVIRHRPADLFERALFFIMTGMVLLFWFATFRGHAEPHWTVAASIPALILIVQYSAVNIRFHRYVRRVVAPSVVLILLLRICLVSDLLPPDLELNGKQARYTAIEKVAGDAPVVFIGSFQPPSLYNYFTGKNATVLSSLDRRHTQYDIWHTDSLFQGKRVLLLMDFPGRSVHYNLMGQQFDGFFINQFQGTHDIWIQFRALKARTVYTGGDVVQLQAVVTNRGSHRFSFQHPELPATIAGVLFSDAGMQLLRGTCSDSLQVLAPGQTIQTTVSFTIPADLKGTYQMGLSCHTIMGPDRNSDFTEINIQP